MIFYALGFEAAAIATVLSSASAFTQTFTVGGAVVAFIVLAAGGWFLVRGKGVERARDDAKEWRDNYLAERQLREDSELRAAEQRELKHVALNELAAARMATDLSAVMTALVEIQKTGTRSLELADKIARRLDRIDPHPSTERSGA